MKSKTLTVAILLAAILALIPGTALADGIIIPEPPICDPGPCPPPPCPGPSPCPPMPPIAQLVIRYHHIRVDIQDQIATTRVDQIFYNPNDWPVEGIYMFPIPAEAAVTSFSLWVDGAPVEGRVLEAAEARAKYEAIVASLKDPALLEYADRGALQASIFPIPPRGERRIELEYAQVLPFDNGLVRYSYPLNTEKFSLWPLESVAINVSIHSSTASLRAIYSPSHDVAIEREGNQHAIVGYEAKDVRPDKDFDLYYSLGEEQAFHLISYREPDGSDSDGFFLALIAPEPEAPEHEIAKDLILVLDRSGSMEGEKFEQARQALRYILEHLNPEDRFNVIAFSTGLDSFSRDLRPAAQAGEALAWVDRLSAQGSTDINRALLEAVYLVGRERPAYLIFLTDGLPTEGVIDSQQILDNLAEATPENLRLFAFGVGYDVDTFLLDSLAQAHHGASVYVRPEERLDEILSGFYGRISTPILTSLSLDFGEVSVYDSYPEPLPDLFAGSQIVLVGRYRQPGAANVKLTGEVGGETRSFVFEDQVFVSASPLNSTSAVIPRLWATRKIGYLLNQVRLRGPDEETIHQIVRLSIRYGIITPYTSYLVTEETPLGAAEQDRIAREQLSQMQSLPAAPAYGQEAVEKAADQGALAGADAPVGPETETAEMVRIVGSRTFVLADGVWIDTAYDPQTMQTIKVSFLSKDYFDLISAMPDLGAGFALGQRVIAVVGGEGFEVVAENAITEPLVIPAIPPSQATLPAPAATPLSTDSPDLGEVPEAGPASNCLGSLGLILLALVIPLVQRRKMSKRDY